MLLYFCVLHLILKLISCKVIELDTSFKYLLSDGPWLVKFYAPWCGYCKKLEPIYHTLSEELRDLPIKVARLDATKYPEIASLFYIRGYPTIKYINGSDVYTHEGDRTVEHLIQFSKRSLGPASKIILNEEKFEEVIKSHVKEPFFLYIGSMNSYLENVFNDVATNKRLYSYFYSTNPQNIPKMFLTNLNLSPSLYSNIENGSIIAWKKEKRILYNFSDNIDSLNSSLLEWVVINRFSTFPKVTQNDVMELSILDKPVVIILLNNTESLIIDTGYTDDDLQSFSSLRYYTIGEKLAMAEDKPMSDLVFAWTDDNVVLSDWAMTLIRSPNIAIFIPTNQTIYLHPSYQQVIVMREINEAGVRRFLRDFTKGRIAGFGGNGFFAKLRRAGYDFVGGLVEFVTAAPLLAMFIIGVPLSVISFLFYAICCMDTNHEDYRQTMRQQRKERPPLYEAPLKSSEELNLKMDGDKKND